ncbi:MAG TPA: peptidase, partial [Gammaproteobacteria bacterium]|nr:peptidase [Gammaproteobacteria bacterium]
ETGARAALPIWIDYMQEALVNRPEWPLVQPPDIVSARIDPKTGKLAGAQAEDAIFEFFTRVQLEALQSQSGLSLERDLQVERAVLF